MNILPQQLSLSHGAIIACLEPYGPDPIVFGPPQRCPLHRRLLRGDGGCWECEAEEVTR